MNSALAQLWGMSPTSSLPLPTGFCSSRRTRTGTGMAGKVVEDLGRLSPLTVPEHGMAVERGEVGPDALAHPAGVVHEALALGLGRAEHGELASRERIAGREDAAGIDRVAERPLPALGNMVIDVAHHRRHIGVAGASCRVSRAAALR